MGAGLVWALACGAVGHEAPYVPAPGEPGPCGTLATFTQATQQAMDDGLFDPIGRQVKQQLMETGQYRVLVDAVLQIARQAPPRILLDGMRVLSDEGGQSVLAPALFDAVDYITGRSETIPGEHYELANVYESVLRYCDPRADFATLRRLLVFELPCPECPERTELFVVRLLTAAAELVGDPEFNTLLEILEVEHEGERAVGRDAVNLLVDLVIQNLASPSFDWHYVRSLLTDAVGRNLQGTTRDRWEALLDLVEIAVDPDVGILPDLQIFLGCLHRHDPNHALAEMMYDFSLVEPVQTSELLMAAADTARTQGGRMLLDYAADVFGILERDPRLASNTLTSIAPLVGEASSRETLPALAALRGRGVASELLGGLDRLLTQCRWDTP